jgi:hypothetical protein
MPGCGRTGCDGSGRGPPVTGDLVYGDAGGRIPGLGGAGAPGLACAGGATGGRGGAGAGRLGSEIVVPGLGGGT